MTPNKVIEIVDGIRTNTYSEEQKLSWISDLDGMVKRLVMQEDDVKQYSYPEDMDRELLIEAPFDSLYTMYVEAMIDYYNREYANYNNSAVMFDGRFTEYKKLYIREHQAKG